MSRQAAVQGTDIGSGAATALQFLAANGSAAAAFRALVAGDLPTITLTGDVTGSASAGSIATAIGANKVLNTMLAQMAAGTVKANITGGTANPADVSLVSAPTASTVMLRDANANVRANVVVQNSATTATAAGTTTLTVGSAPFQQFSGTTTQTVVLPDATTLTNGYAFSVANRSTGVVTVQANGGGTLQAQAAATLGVYTLISNGTSAGTWDVSYAAPSSGGGGGMAGGGYLAKSANYNLASGDSTKVIGCDSTSAAFNLTFPTPAVGLMFTVKDLTGQFGTNAVTMVRAGSEKIENLAASMILSANYGSWTFYCGDGTNWIIIAH